MSGAVFYILGIFTFNVPFHFHNKNVRWDYYSSVANEKTKGWVG